MRRDRLLGFLAVGAVALLLAACGGSEPTLEVQVVPDTTEDVSREVALSWPEKFCQLRPGMTRREVRTIMGEPTSETLTGQLSQDSWNAYQFSITAFYHERAQIPDPMDYRAYQLNPNVASTLTAEDEGLFPCGTEMVGKGASELGD